MAAVISVGILFFGYVLVPTMFGQNSHLKAAATGLKPVFLLLSFIFAAIAFIKWLAQLKESAKTPSLDIVRSPSPTRPPQSHWRQARKTATSVRVEPVLTPRKEDKGLEWSLELIQSIEWKRFEDVCQKFYELKGIRSECTALGPDGGIDIRLFQDDNNPQQATAIVQCKAWGDSFVGVKPIRELLGVMVHEKIVKAFFMTSGSYSEEAKAFAAPNRITLIDGKMLLAMFNRLAAEPREELLAFATGGDYNVPTCPSCGTKMRLIPGKEGRRDFWGCGDYPKCRKKLGARKGANTIAAYYE